jgi:hypothetical protein
MIMVLQPICEPLAIYVSLLSLGNIPSAMLSLCSHQEGWFASHLLAIAEIPTVEPPSPTRGDRNAPFKVVPISFL